jgi:hypothetical protein
MGTTHGVPPERLETLHFAVGSRRLIARSRALPEIRPTLGFLESDFEDLVAVDACDDGEAWVRVREVLPRRRRNEEAGLPITCGSSSRSWASAITGRTGGTGRKARIINAGCN